MRVSDIEIIPVEIPTNSRDEELGLAPYIGGFAIEEQPEDLSLEEALERCEDESYRSRLLVRLETDEGITGWGEMPGSADSAPMVRSIIEQLIEPKLLDHPVWNIEALLEEFTNDAYGLGYRDPTAYFGGVEMAMWDALGKEAGKPVYQLLGGKVTDSVPVAFCMGIMPIDDARQKAREAREHGFDVIKTKGSRYWRRDVERLVAIHEAVDGEVDLRLDPNRMWSDDVALRVGAKLAAVGVHLEYLEQPIDSDSFGSLKRLRERLTQPIAINEDAYLPHHVYHAVTEDAIDAAVVDMQPSGGLLGLKRLAGLAAEANVSLSHHSGHDLGIKNAAKAHAYASMPQLDLAFDCTLYTATDDVLEEPLEIENGRMAVPERPGLAGPIDEATITEYRTD
jgi:L-Ala-D/L-Glu epimerase